MIVFCLFGFSSLQAFSLKNTYWSEVGEIKNVSPYLLYAIAIKETMMQKKDSEKGLITPHLWAMNSPTLPGKYYDNQLELIHNIKKLTAKNIKNIDIGVMQINVKWHAYRVNSIYELTDPRTNIKVGADILNDALRSTNDVIKGVGRYHNPKNKIALKYGSHVLNIYINLVKLADIYEYDFAFSKVSARDIESILDTYFNKKEGLNNGYFAKKDPSSERHIAITNKGNGSLWGVDFTHILRFYNDKKSHKTTVKKIENQSLLRVKNSNKAPSINNSFLNNSRVFSVSGWESKVFK